MMRIIHWILLPLVVWIAIFWAAVIMLFETLYYLTFGEWRWMPAKDVPRFMRSEFKRAYLD